VAAVVLPVNQFDRTKIELINNRRLDKLHAVDVCDHCQTKRWSLTVVTLPLDNYAGFGTRQSTHHVSSPLRDHQIKWKAHSPPRTGCSSVYDESRPPSCQVSRFRSQPDRDERPNCLLIAGDESDVNRTTYLVRRSWRVDYSRSQRHWGHAVRPQHDMWPFASIKRVVSDGVAILAQEWDVDAREGAASCEYKNNHDVEMSNGRTT
jgi:hypothetical protein